jgi:phenylacetate-coenzyme A ligase PaaK-like adenylate-forming protein
VLRTRADVLEYQVAQTAAEAITVSVVTGVGADVTRIEREVRQGFQALLGEQVRIDVERVAAIPRLPGGKVAVISALPSS